MGKQTNTLNNLKKLSCNAFSYLLNNFHYQNNDFTKRKEELAILTKKIREDFESQKQELKQLKKENKELSTKLSKVCNAFYKSYNCLLGCEQYNLMSIKNDEYEKELYNIIDEAQNGRN